MLYLLVSSILASLNQIHAENAALTSCTTCRSGEAGAVFINVVIPGQGSPTQNFNRTYSANDATGCLTVYSITLPAGIEQYRASIDNISPISGGYCQLYSTDNCDQGKVMTLTNPRNYSLKYPE
jgi:hypothetical protein